MSIIVNKKTNISFLWHFCFYPKFFDIELTTDELQNLGTLHIVVALLCPYSLYDQAQEGDYGCLIHDYTIF